MKNWLEIAVAVYLLGMVLYGHYRGAVRLAFSVASLVLTLGVVHAAMPYTAAFIRDKTPVQSWIRERVDDIFRVDGPEGFTGEGQPEEEHRFIEALQLPDEWKDLLIENNNAAVYERLGVEKFTEYVGSYLAGVIVNLFSYVLLFVVVYVLFRLLVKALNLAARLPVLSGINQLAGALLGGLEGLFFLWLASLLVTACSGTKWASSVLAMIDASPWLAFLYRSNFLSRLVLGIIRSIVA